ALDLQRSATGELGREDVDGPARAATARALPVGPDDTVDVEPRRPDGHDAAAATGPVSAATLLARVVHAVVGRAGRSATLAEMAAAAARARRSLPLLCDARCMPECRGVDDAAAGHVQRRVEEELDTSVEADLRVDRGG